MTATTEAAIVTAEQAAIARGWAVYRNTMNSMWPESIRWYVGHARADLLDALEMYSLVLNEDIHPVEAFDGITPGDGAHAEAIARAAGNVTEWTDELLRVFPAAAKDDRLAAGAAEVTANNGGN